MLDVNNIYVSASNHGWDSETYLNEIPAELVKEIHLAGHEQKTFEDGTSLRIDTHSRLVLGEVWALFKLALKQGMRCPTLIEWDKDIPILEVLLEEAEKAQAYIDQAEGEKWVA